MGTILAGEYGEVVAGKGFEKIENGAERKTKTAKNNFFEKIESFPCIFRQDVLIYLRLFKRAKQNIRVWRSLVSRLNGVQEAAGSNPVTRTN